MLGSEDEEEDDGEVSRFAGVGDDASLSLGLVLMRERFLVRESGLSSAGRFDDVGLSFVSFPDGCAWKMCGNPFCECGVLISSLLVVGRELVCCGEGVWFRCRITTWAFLYSKLVGSRDGEQERDVILSFHLL